jgi:site-specific recombinase XerD
VSAVEIPELPRTTRRFLRTRRGHRARYVVRALHRWLHRRRLSLADLTQDLIGQFLARPARKRLAPRTSYAYWHSVRLYLEWLHERALITLDPDHLRRHPKQLPRAAREFVASLAPTHSPSTCRGYTVSLRRFHGWLARHRLAVDELTRSDIVPWFQELHAAGLHPSTRVHLLQQARSYLHWLSERQPVKTSPDDLIRPSDLPKLPSYLPRPLTIDGDRELQRRLAASDDPAAIGLLIMRHTGLRIGELRSLEYDCLRPHKTSPLLKVPLGKLNNERLVPVDAETVDLVRRLQATPPRARAWLLPGDGGELISRERLCRVLEDAARGLADPTRITSHRLRHTYATEMLSAGMSLLGVMRLLGHRDYRMTLRYTAITPETVGEEYHKALTHLATKYRLPTPPVTAALESPDEILDHLARWLRKHAPAQRSLRAVLKRIERLQNEVRNITAPTKK